MKLTSRQPVHWFVIGLIVSAVGLVPAIVGTRGSVFAQTPTPQMICGTVGNYVPSTATATGSVTVNGSTYTIAAASSFGGTGSTVIVGSAQCLNVTFNASGGIVSGTVTPYVPVTNSAAICGTVGNYVPSTAAATGTLTVSGVTYTIAAGSSFGGTGSTVIVGSPQCFNVSLNAAGAIASGTAASYFGSAPIVTFCGTLTAFTPSPTQGSGFGSVTISGMTFTVAVNTILTGQAAIPTPIPAGYMACLSAVLSTANPGQTVVVSGAITPVASVPLAATPAPGYSGAPGHGRLGMWAV